MYNTHSMSQSSAGLVISFAGASGEKEACFILTRKLLLFPVAPGGMGFIVNHLDNCVFYGQNTKENVPSRKLRISCH